MRNLISIKLAWRNLWRNKKRTLITCSSIVFAVVLAVLLNSVKEGVLLKLKENSVNYFTGPIQIQAKGYKEEQSLENSYVYTSAIDSCLNSTSGITAYAQRLESFALGAGEEKTRACLILGIDPVSEDKVTKLRSKLIDGHYLNRDDRSVMISSGLSDKLNLKTQDTLVIIGQGYHGISAAAKYPIKGITKFASPELNKRLVHLPLLLAQELFGTGDRLSSTIVQLSNIEKSEKTSVILAARLPEYHILNWKEMMPELDQIIRNERVESIVFLFVLYALISFGIFGTILMMLYERKYEFGVLNAIGLRNSQLSRIVVLENIMISLLGSAVGLILSFPIVYYFHRYPIQLGDSLKEIYENFGFEPVFYFSIAPQIFYSQAIVVLTISLLLSFYPIVKIMNLDPVESMRN